MAAHDITVPVSDTAVQGLQNKSEAEFPSFSYLFLQYKKFHPALERYCLHSVNFCIHPADRAPEVQKTVLTLLNPQRPDATVPDRFSFPHRLKYPYQKMFPVSSKIPDNS